MPIYLSRVASFCLLGLLNNKGLLLSTPIFSFEATSAGKVCKLTLLDFEYISFHFVCLKAFLCIWWTTHRRMMAKQCNKCSEAITGIDFVVCRGYCEGVFHMSACSGVTRAMQSYLTAQRKNLFWMCDGCADLFENAHFRAISSRIDEKSPLTSLVSAITDLRTEIKQLNVQPNNNTASIASPRWPAIDERRGIKRPRLYEANVRASDSCRVGSKKPQESVASVPICKNDEDKRFWLNLSKICPDVTVEAVCAMTKANLNIETDPIVVKLVPKGKALESLSFVSFKIGLDSVLKQKALDPETWPEGLMFREFENYGSAKFRLPKKTNMLATPLLIPQTAIPTTPIMDC